jgi:hypothetical protein
MSVDDCPITLSNIPIHNLRREFEEYLALFRTPSFRSEEFGCRLRSVQLRNLMWCGLPNELLTFMLRSAILGVESYIPAAVDYELTRRKLLSDEARRVLENPFTLVGGTAQAFYDKLPTFVDESVSLSRYDGPLFERVRLFYRRVRNPLFDGNEIAFSGENYDAVVTAFEMFAEVYDWIDSWYGAFSSGWRDRRTTIGNC